MAQEGTPLGPKPEGPMPYAEQMNTNSIQRLEPSAGLEVVPPGPSVSKPKEGTGWPPYGAHGAYPHGAYQKKKICGLRPKFFWMVMVVITAIIAAAIIVAAVVASQNSSDDDDSSSSASSGDSTPTATLDPSEVPSATETEWTTIETDVNFAYKQPQINATTGLADLVCPRRNQTSYNTQGGSTLEIYCSMAIRTDAADITRTFSYSLSACMEVCGTWTRFNSDRPCVAITYHQNMTDSLKNFGNCALKSEPGSFVEEGDYVASAFLLD
ncbi:hypothetical protein BDY21DRAFT_370388 [Lineolata rhizophorae]|uniref:Apple domain-containing protein n=1 Tax=Lineolata rhizophorae TaxID=578093 RepID=A0A6A6P4V2_9PEZI|nr:hypothetical protein BDY21DRAFT_370388 [Lineolata rhizophorae]